MLMCCCGLMMKWDKKQPPVRASPRQAGCGLMMKWDKKQHYLVGHSTIKVVVWWWNEIRNNCGPRQSRCPRVVVWWWNEIRNNQCDKKCLWYSVVVWWWNEIRNNAGTEHRGQGIVVVWWWNEIRNNWTDYMSYYCKLWFDDEMR